jgi:hypothetical protein
LNVTQDLSKSLLDSVPFSQGHSSLRGEVVRRTDFGGSPSSLPVGFSHDIIEDKFGRPRLSRARESLLDSLDDDETLEKTVQAYKYWRDFSEYLVLKRPGHLEYLAVKCSKRGNDRYVYRIKDRFRFLSTLQAGLSAGISSASTRFVFVSLTWNVSLCSRKEALSHVGVDYNRWISGLRRRFGRISAVRTFEVTKNGYVHGHVVLYFHEKSFSYFSRTGKLRLQEKNAFTNWHSFVDVQACKDVKSALGYLTKYVTKTVASQSKEDDEMRARTFALMWLTRKRSFSVSGDFVDLIRDMRNSNSQRTLDGTQVDDPSVWQNVGIFPAGLLVSYGLDPGLWACSLDGIPA